MRQPFYRIFLLSGNEAAHQAEKRPEDEAHRYGGRDVVYRKHSGDRKDFCGAGSSLRRDLDFYRKEAFAW